MDKTLDIINNSGAFIKGQSQFIKEVLREKVVDLGLPSGLKWAVCDIDVTQKDGFCKTPFTYNKSFFSWGNIIGHNPKNNSFEEVYDWGGINPTEPWYDGQVYGNTKGNTLTGNIPISEEFDAARAILGSPLRMPTSDNYVELFNGCIFIDETGAEIPDSTTDKRTTVNGVLGIYLQSKTNGKRIFFSASGRGNELNWNVRGINGYYWASTYNSPRYAKYMLLYSGGVIPQDNSNRYVGLAIRAVHE